MRGKGPLHFHNIGDYHRFLSYIHIHHKTKGHHRPVYIAGHLHHVCHHCGSVHHKTHEHHMHAEHGFHGIIEHPTIIEVGEHDKPERVDITPMQHHKKHHEHDIESLGNLDHIMQGPLGVNFDFDAMKISSTGHPLKKAYKETRRARNLVAEHRSILGPDYDLSI